MSVFFVEKNNNWVKSVTFCFSESGLSAARVLS